VCKSTRFEVHNLNMQINVDILIYIVLLNLEMFQKYVRVIQRNMQFRTTELFQIYSKHKMRMVHLRTWLCSRVYIGAGMLQCVAVCYSVLQCVAVCCSGLLCVLLCVLQCVLRRCVTACCSVLQCVAVCCRVLQGVWCICARGYAVERT